MHCICSVLSITEFPFLFFHKNVHRSVDLKFKVLLDIGLVMSTTLSTIIILYICFLTVDKYISKFNICMSSLCNIATRMCFHLT